MTYVDLFFQGKLSVPKKDLEKFLQDFEQFLHDHKTEFDGKIKSFEFEPCEVID